MLAVPLWAAPVAGETAATTGTAAPHEAAAPVPPATVPPTTATTAPTTTTVPTTTNTVPTTTTTEPAGRTITVTPDTDLVPGQVVEVSGSGFTPGSFLGAAMCIAGATSLDDCSLNTGVYLDADADGNVSTPFTVQRLIYAGGGIVDCATAPGACVLGLGDIFDLTDAVWAPLSFDPDAPLPSPSLSVDPAGDLVDRQEVTVEGAGWPADEGVGLAQCPAGEGPYNCVGPGGYGDSVTGEFSTTMWVRRFVRTEDGPSLDCASAPGACEIVAWAYGDLDWMARAPLAFDPDASFPDPPAVTVTPDSGLVDRQEVVVDGANFAPDAYLNLSLCDVAGEVCRWVEAGEPLTDGSGAFSATVRLRRLIPLYGADPIDCATAACVIIARVYGDYEYEEAQASVAFDPGVPLPDPPTVSADPATDLVDHQIVAVTGAGWTPGARVVVEQCATVPGEGDYCGPPNRDLIADESGVLSGTTLVVRNFSYWDYEGTATIDCATAAGTCKLHAVDIDDWYDEASTPLDFDPEAPPAPPPTLEATPSTDLVDRQEINVHGEGFLPGYEIQLEQCGPGEGPSCRGWAYVETDDDGNFDTTFTVRRLIGSLSQPLVDCAVDACVVLALSWNDPAGTATTALGFDPDVMPILPVVTVEPNVGLADGSVVTVRGSDFTPYSTAAIVQCRGDALDATGCDIMRFAYAYVGPSGSFETEFAAKAQIDVGGSAVDCTAQPGACLMGAANLSDFSEANRDWITFGDPPLLTAGSVSVDEGDEGTTTVEVPVTISTPSLAPVSVGYSLVGGSAGAEDFAAASGTLLLDPGASGGTIEVTVNGDEVDELDETLQVVLSDPVHAAVAAEPGVVTIVDDDVPTVRGGIGWVFEGNRGTRVMRIPVTLSAPSPEEVTVEVSTAGFTARPRSDYVEYEGTVTFAPGEDSKVVEVTVRGDRRREGIEFLLLRLSGATNATIAWPGVGIGAIIDDD